MADGPHRLDLTPTYSKLTLHLVFVAPGETTSFDVEVPRYGTVVLRDFVSERFNRQSALGMVRVFAEPSDAVIAARAWVYNVGGGAELGQNVQGIERSSLPRRAFVPSLSMLDGNRSSLGISNPNDAVAQVTVTGYTEKGTSLREVSLRIAAQSVFQADLLNIFGSDALSSGVTVHVASDLPVYACGAVVRNASGDPYFVIGAAPEDTDLAGREIVIPLAGRAPGGFGTDWKTDLILSNLSPDHPILTLRVEFLGQTREVEVPRYGTVTLRDFGQAGELGMARISAAQADAVIAARGWIYNHGGGVELGQNVQGLALASLPTQAVIPSLLITDGNRANFGIANPGDAEAEVVLDALHLAARRTIRVAPRTTVQFDAATFFDRILEPHAATIHVRSNVPMYAYGSVIRNGSGDPHFVAGATHRDYTPLAPQCERPATLYLQRLPASGWIVVFHWHVDAVLATERFSAKYGFTPAYVYQHALKGFSAELTPEALAGLRCEPEVSYVEQSSYVLPDGAA